MPTTALTLELHISDAAVPILRELFTAAEGCAVALEDDPGSAALPSVNRLRSALTQLAGCTKADFLAVPASAIS